MNWNSQNNKDKDKKAKREIKRYLLDVGFIMGNVLMKIFFWGLFLRIFCSGSSLNGSSRGRMMDVIKIVKIVTMVTILAGLGFVFGVVWQCIPIQAVWKVDGGRGMEGAKCLNRKVFLYSFGVFDVLMDLIVSWILISFLLLHPFITPLKTLGIFCCELTIVIPRYMSFRSLSSTVSPSPAPTDSA